MENESTFIQEERQAGYSQEDAYFDKRDRDLIKTKRKELDEKRMAKSQSLKPSNWMQCPKCGTVLTEIDFSNIKADRCSKCEGVYFDKAELEIMIDTKNLRTYLNKVRAGREYDNDIF
jgi:Zn-finger nucleic acid-binding protein